MFWWVEDLRLCMTNKFYIDSTNFFKNDKK